MLKIYAIKTPAGFFITDKPQPKSYESSCLQGMVVNGKPLAATFDKNWFSTEELPQSIKEKGTRTISKIFHLVDRETFNNLPQSIPYDEVFVGYDQEGYHYYTEKFEKIKNLYILKEEKEEILVDVDFELIQLAEVDLVPGVVPFSYKVEGVRKITNDSVKYPVLTQITTPSILHPATPCFLTSKETYDIVRSYVKQNIDPSVAKVSSDYDFCFSVVKLIELYTPEEYVVDVNALYSRRKPKYETRYRKHREVRVFEMTHEDKCYEGYTPIKGFSANSQAKLAKKIEEYLQDLMKMINEPLVDCPHCKGMGVIHKPLKQ